MRVSTKFALALATLLLGLLLVPSAALALTQDCPAEPVSGTPIGDGEVFFGPNCTLQSPGDIDSFVFNASNGDTYHLAVAINGAAPSNICLTLYNPSAVSIFSQCSSVGFPNYRYSVVTNQMLTATGLYTIVVSETVTGTLNYGLHLERLYPFPPDAQAINLGVLTPGDITPLTDTNAFTFESATTGTERVSATLPNNASQNLCMAVYLTNGTRVQTPVCTSIGFPNYQYTININFTPTQDSTSMAFVWVAGDDGTATYTIEVSCLVGTCPVQTQTFTTLHAFTFSDGANSSAGLVQGTDGNLYGTTSEGGNSNTRASGTVFKISPGGTFTLLYRFCSQSGCTDGLDPRAGLVKATDGNFYGTTREGGTYNYGTVFKITASGTLTTLYSFRSMDGANPEAKLVQGTDLNFYGTTSGGGTNDRGTVFKITPSGTLTTLYSFCSQIGCWDGDTPEAGLIQATDGNFYGTTYGGGGYRRGAFFRITPSGTLTTLHSFILADGVSPQAGLVQATDGNFYGTASRGGDSDWGTVFKITPSGTLTKLHSFNYGDGGNPEAGLIQAADGNFYGTTYGGDGARGEIFEMTPSGTLTPLYGLSFSHGANSEAGLIQLIDGNFYGTTYWGGSGFGTVFKLHPGQ